MFRNTPRFYGSMSRLIEDFAPGPLDFYRKKASFDWKKLKTYLFTEEIIKYEVSVDYIYNRILISRRMTFTKFSKPTLSTKRIYSRNRSMRKGAPPLDRLSRFTT